MVSATPAILLSSMATEAVCERVRQIEGIDQSMMGQYSATIRKVPWPHRYYQIDMMIDLLFDLI